MQKLEKKEVTILFVLDVWVGLFLKSKHPLNLGQVDTV